MSRSPVSRVALAFTSVFIVIMGWMVAGSLSSLPLPETASLIVAQGFLAVLVGLVLAARRPGAGVDITVVLPLHVALYYGLSNVVPALLPELRPDDLAAVMAERVPSAPPGAYAVATLAAAFFLAGALVGAVTAFRCLPARAAAIRARGLPSGSTAAAALVVLFALVVFGTSRYGLGYAVVLSDADVVAMPLAEQLFFHGLFWYLPIGPALAAMVWLGVRRRRPTMAMVLALASLCLVALLAVWRMRSIAMIAVLLPILILAARGAIDSRRWALPALVLGLTAYGAITFVRVSDLESVVAERGEEGVSLSDLRQAVTRRSSGVTVLQRAALDASYRLAGLEPVAALVDALERGTLVPQGGTVLLSGFLQALPASLRPEIDMPLRVKTAPTRLGVFGSGDWLTTLLAEAVLDAGVWATFLPGFVAGLLLGFFDRVLLVLGARPGLEGLLVARMAFLLYPVTVSASVADMTLLFAKATAGYTVVLLVAGAAVRAAVRPRAVVGGRVAG